MKPTAFLVCSILLTLSAERLHAQTAAQRWSEGAFLRTLIRAEDAKDCHLALRLLDEREAVIKSQALEFGRNRDRSTPASESERMYLYEQIRGLESRRVILSRECR
jgi:hypothetical protein